MTDALLTLRQEKLTLHKKALKSKTSEDHAIYIAHRNLYNSQLRLGKQLYYSENLNKNVKNSKRTWELLKEAANLTKNTNKIEKIDKDGTILTDPTEIATEFNDFFTGIGQKISRSVKPTIVKPEHYMPNLPDVADLDLGSTSQGHICDIIKSLQPKNSCDVDGLSTKLLKKLSIELSLPLAHIFGLSLDTGTFPARLKTSRTVPVFKAGRSDLCDNYRPIALLSTLSKILEKIVKSSL
jgi:hypothetical protein